MDNLQNGSAVDYANRILELGAAAVKPLEKPDGSGLLVVIPEGMKPHEVQDRRYVGDHVKQSLTVIDPDSLASYLAVHKDKDGQTVIFADQDTNSVLGVLNYHEAGKVNRADHRALLKLQFDPTYAEWRKVDGLPIDQADFGRFLEENAADITSPDPAQIIEIARSLEVTTAIDFKKAVNLSNGLVQIQYVEQDQTRTSGSFEIPKELTIKAPVYFGGELQEIRFFFRYIAKGGTLKFRLDMHRKAYIEREAFLAITRRIGEASSVPVYLGKIAA
jgi:uncharacterized protein YfdQ (DUF2303 family)